MSIQPKGEDLRKAVKWVSDERQFNPGKESKTLIMRIFCSATFLRKKSKYLVFSI